MPRARHGNSLPVETNGYLQAFMLGWLRDHPGETKATLARTIGVSGAHVTNITLHGRGAGADVEEAVARHLGVTVDELRKRAREEHRAEPDSLELLRDDRYPNRARALRFMEPETSPEGRARVESMQLQSDVDPPASWWVREIERAEQMVRMEQSRPLDAAKRNADAARESAAAEDVTRPKRRKA